MSLFRKIAAFAVINTVSYSALATEGDALFDPSSEALKSRMASVHIKHKKAWNGG
ncbi:hypothetical protein IQ22_01734 [Pseudomonas duriflava]|uniref:Uncharacterized protein n=1 Tax=Pseudomonas duriflava TaxID=459528 RepID=A0A562QDK8_9PSED|nr:hypothetical protein [Pseudomonas duriflava]TWI54831.1 hypothetical protein IQ22_01734 [Pseudomonas duriflava]